MITLKTGVPGASKTLSAVHELAVLLGKQIKGKEETRPIFVHGVKDLSLPHFDLPDGSKWTDCPDGAIVIIDEAQGTFPPRSSTSKAPPHVEALNTHRHRGIDLIVITQHPKLIDQSIRRLVGKHQHYRRLYGGKTSICYEWDHCEDSLTSIRTAAKSVFRQPRDAYKYYKSAEVHTKQRFRVPPFLMLFPLAAIGLVFYGGPTLARILSGKPSEAQLAAITAQGGASSPDSIAEGGYAVSSAVMAAASAPPPPIVGCIKVKARCECVDAVGVSVPVDYDKCNASSERGGLLVPYNLAALATGQSQSPRLPVVASASGASPVALSSGYAPRDPVRDLSGVLGGSLGDQASDDVDGQILAGMRRP